MKKIPLNSNEEAIVDDEDFELVNQWKWYSHRPKGTDQVYAARNPGRVGDSRFISMHRFILGAKPGQMVDHRDGDGLNNRRGNLRLCNRSQNAANSVLQMRNTSGFKGVRWSRAARKWIAQIKIDRKQVYLGLFSEPVEAAKAYDSAALNHFGAYAKTNQQLGLYV